MKNDLIDALRGPKGSLDSWLECNNEDEVRAAISALISSKESLRDKFAGKAMQGLLANPGGPIQSNASSGWSLVNCTLAAVADEAYSIADAMLRAREKQS